MHIAMIGTRGVPARYGGFETAVEEIGRRLVERGHRLTVFCRHVDGTERLRSYLGMDLVYLPKVRHKALETLSHTGASVVHEVIRDRADVALLFNAANAVFLPMLRAGRVPVATHVDGLEWRRAKWGPTGRRYYRLAESLAVRWSDALIADAAGIADYYRVEFGATTHEIAYGAPILGDIGSEKLGELGLEPRGFHLVVARFEPENHVELIVRGYSQSSASLPLVVVGSAPYAGEYTKSIESLAAADPRLRLVGGVWDQQLLDQMYTNAVSYIHGHSVGGTNPSLLRAMGAGAPTVAYDVSFNSAVLGENGRLFRSAGELARLIQDVEADPSENESIGRRLQARASQTYTWDSVTEAYDALCRELSAGQSQRGRFSGRRVSTWTG